MVVSAVVNFTHGLLLNRWQLGAISSRLGNGDRRDSGADLDGIFYFGLSAMGQG